MKFVIWAFPFDDTSGGGIALHLLCHRLNEMGHKAEIFVPSQAALFGKFSFKEAAADIWRRANGRKRKPAASPFNTPIARRGDAADAIVVYPEVVEGNPLRSNKVVRWLLHRPGNHTGKALYGPDDLFFFYQEAFNAPPPSAHSASRLTLTWINSCYQQTNTGERRGSCFLMRKGKGKQLVHDLGESTPIDALSHAEKAAVFNRTKYFFSYDLYTYYNVYAAICGCIPVVVPEAEISREQWLPDAEDRYGLAYGMDDVEWAIATRPQLLQRLQDGRREEDEMLAAFVEKCRTTFNA
jgi:hypothetical protein